MKELTRLMLQEKLYTKAKNFFESHEEQIVNCGFNVNYRVYGSESDEIFLSYDEALSYFKYDVAVKVENTQLDIQLIDEDNEICDCEMLKIAFYGFDVSEIETLSLRIKIYRFLHQYEHIIDDRNVSFNYSVNNLGEYTTEEMFDNFYEAELYYTSLICENDYKEDKEEIELTFKLRIDGQYEEDVQLLA